MVGKLSAHRVTEVKCSLGPSCTRKNESLGRRTPQGGSRPVRAPGPGPVPVPGRDSRPRSPRTHPSRTGNRSHRSRGGSGIPPTSRRVILGSPAVRSGAPIVTPGDLTTEVRVYTTVRVTTEEVPTTDSGDEEPTTERVHTTDTPADDAGGRRRISVGFPVSARVCRIETGPVRSSPTREPPSVGVGPTTRPTTCDPSRSVQPGRRTPGTGTYTGRPGVVSGATSGASSRLPSSERVVSPLSFVGPSAPGVTVASVPTSSRPTCPSSASENRPRETHGTRRRVPNF